MFIPINVASIGTFLFMVVILEVFDFKITIIPDTAGVSKYRKNIGTLKTSL